LVEAHEKLQSETDIRIRELSASVQDKEARLQKSLKDLEELKRKMQDQTSTLSTTQTKLDESTKKLVRIQFDGKILICRMFLRLKTRL
jgi:flagellin-like hook-associated protein FlgL